MEFASNDKKPGDTWKFYPERKGTKHSIWDCYYCGLANNKVEAAGMWYCPNPKCTGPGGAWFRARLDSYKENGSGHTVDEAEWNEKADAYILEHNLMPKPVMEFKKLDAIINEIKTYLRQFS